MLMSTCLINQIPSMVPGFKSLMTVFSNHFLYFHITCKLTVKIFGCVSFIHIHAHNRGKFLPTCFEVCLCMLFYHKKKKEYKCYHPPLRKFFISMDFTISKKQSSFSTPYLQGERTTIEDKDQFLLDLSLPLGSLGFTRLINHYLLVCYPSHFLKL